MKGIKNRESIKWKRLFAFFALLVVFGVLVNSARKVYDKKKEAQKALAQMEGEAKSLEARKIFLDSSLQKLETDEGVAFEIRRKLNMAGAGESVAIIIDEGQPTSTNNTQVSSWQKIKNFFVWLFE